jgi:protein SCO1/2
MRKAPKIALVAVIVLLAAAPAAFVAFRPVTVIPRLSLAPGFALRDQDGERLTSDDLRGHLTLYGFTSTGCRPPECAGVTPAMRSVRDGLAKLDLGDVPVRLVTVSFDPERDDPARLREAAMQVGAEPPGWSFAVPADTTAARALVGSGFGVWYEARPNGTFRSDPVLLLVDGLGIRRVEYRVGTPDAEQILADIGELATEARAEGAMRFAYEAAHFFSCYSR